MSTSEGGSDPSTVETEDTISLGVEEMTQATDTAPVDTVAAAGAPPASPNGTYEPNVPPPAK